MNTSQFKYIEGGARMFRTMSIITILAVMLFSTNALGKEWYEGGTLHRETAGVWHSSSYSNRLATASDFATTGSGSTNLEVIRIIAIELEVCITEATDDPSLYGQKVSSMAVLCLIQMGYGPK